MYTYLGLFLGIPF